MRDAVSVSNDSPVLLDRFLNAAVEVDIDAVSDGEELLLVRSCSILSRLECIPETLRVHCPPTVCLRMCRTKCATRLSRWLVSWVLSGLDERAVGLSGWQGLCH